MNGLQALEFTDCLLDSPEFRENLNRHEKELERTSSQIKRIIKEVKDLLSAAKSKWFINCYYLCLSGVYVFNFNIRTISILRALVAQTFKLPSPNEREYVLRQLRSLWVWGCVMYNVHIIEHLLPFVWYFKRV